MHLNIAVNFEVGMLLNQWFMYNAFENMKRSFQRGFDAYDPLLTTVDKAIESARALRAHFDLTQNLGFFFRTSPQEIKQEKYLKNGVKILVSTPPAPNDRVVLYVHGGAFVLGLMTIQMDFAAQLSKASNTIVWSVDYRLAPEHPFPAGLEDVFAVYKSMLSEGIKPNKITLVGESAGGNLLLGLLLKIKQEKLPLPGAAVPISALTDFNMTGESYQTREHLDPMLPVDRKKTVHFSYLRGESPDNPLASPLLGDLTDLPPLLIMVGGREILHSDSINFAEKAKKAGVDVTLDVDEKMFHAYPLFYNTFDEAKLAIGKISLFIQMKT